MIINDRKLTDPTTTISITRIPSVTIQVLKHELSISSNDVIQNIIDKLIVEYDATGTISEESASTLIGQRPKPPKASGDTQFMDSWLIADQEYERKLRYIKQTIVNLVAELKS